MNQVVQIDVDGQVFVDTDGDRLDERQVIEHDLVALDTLARVSARWGKTSGAALVLGSVSFFVGVLPVCRSGAS